MVFNEWEKEMGFHEEGRRTKAVPVDALYTRCLHDMRHLDALQCECRHGVDLVSAGLFVAWWFVKAGAIHYT